jgi:hypothetical protein
MSGAPGTNNAPEGGIDLGDLTNKWSVWDDPGYYNYAKSFGISNPEWFSDNYYQSPYEGLMSYQQWKALTGSLPASGNGTTPPVTPPPVTPPSPSDQLQGLMAQAADPYGTYGQLGVANPYLQNIQNRFGYDPSGLAYGVNLQQSPSWYNPGIAHPNVVYPAIKGGATTGTTSTGIKWPT